MLLFSEAPGWLQVGVGVLAVWRLTMLVTTEAGPGDILVKGREWLGVSHDENGVPFAWEGIGVVLSCFWCASVWVAAVVMLLPWQLNALLALSGGAILLDTWRSRGPG